MPVSERSSDKCTCEPPDNPSVIGACACPRHGMKALRAEVEQLRAHNTLLDAALRRKDDEIEKLRSSYQAEVERLRVGR